MHRQPDALRKNRQTPLSPLRRQEKWLLQLVARRSRRPRGKSRQKTHDQTPRSVHPRRWRNKGIRCWPSRFPIDHARHVYACYRTYAVHISLSSPSLRDHRHRHLSPYHSSRHGTRHNRKHPRIPHRAPRNDQRHAPRAQQSPNPERPESERHARRSRIRAGAGTGYLRVVGFDAARDGCL
ncbi:hypothetical protein FB45DRAFT_927239 [Roridomyces roridus]|uniref:Uncharacterized protein n=1 Tax=Roridomyces roridus TaxID=1738132 RepID=A0AAD7BIJ2_9AGAR|nr:hypothetical protein FB45DRAFT_927239 [Roridomyces roridus]